MCPFIGGGLVTAMYPYLILQMGSLGAGLALCGASIALLVVLRLFFWNKEVKLQQR